MVFGEPFDQNQIKFTCIYSFIPDHYTFQNIRKTPPEEAGISRLVECLPENTGAVLTWVWFPHAARNFSPNQLSVQTLLGFFSLTVSIQPPCAIACINICAHVKNSKDWQPYHCLDTWKYCTPTEMGSSSCSRCSFVLYNKIRHIFQ